MEEKIKDPKMRLVPAIIHIYLWQKEEIERLGVNLSKMCRDYLDERLEKTKEVELAELQADIEDQENILAAKKAMLKSLSESLELKKERDKEKFLEENLDAFVLKKWLSEGHIPNNSPIFSFPDRERFINDINDGKISQNSSIEEFRKYNFKVLTKSDPDSRVRFKKMFSEFMESGVMK